MEPVVQPLIITITDDPDSDIEILEDIVDHEEGKEKMDISNEVVAKEQDDQKFKLNMEITELRNLLDCPVCYEVILPPIFLCEGGHSICSSCKNNLASCPSCRGAFTDIRNVFAEELLERCLVTCRHRESGCRVQSTGTELPVHIQVCNYRPVHCRSCELDIPHSQFLNHVRACFEMTPFMVDEQHSGFNITEDDFVRSQEEEVGIFWTPVWIHFYDQHFFCFLESENSNWWLWVGGFGSPEACEKFKCSIFVWCKETRSRHEYVGRIHPIRTSPKSVLESGHCLSLTHVQMKNLVSKGGMHLLIRIDKRLNLRRMVESDNSNGNVTGSPSTSSPPAEEGNSLSEASGNSTNSQ